MHLYIAQPILENCPNENFLTFHVCVCELGNGRKRIYDLWNASTIDVRGAYVTPELKKELQCNVEKIYLVFICIEKRVA